MPTPSKRRKVENTSRQSDELDTGTHLSSYATGSMTQSMESQYQSNAPLSIATYGGMATSEDTTPIHKPKLLWEVTVVH